MRLARTTVIRNSEPKSITKTRARIQSALLANYHLLNMGLIPVFDSFEFEAISMEGK